MNFKFPQARCLCISNFARYKIPLAVESSVKEMVKLYAGSKQVLGTRLNITHNSVQLKCVEKHDWLGSVPDCMC